MLDRHDFAFLAFLVACAAATYLFDKWDRWQRRRKWLAKVDQMYPLQKEE